jgi:hypothetical protein
MTFQQKLSPTPKKIFYVFGGAFFAEEWRRTIFGIGNNFFWNI